MSMLIRLYLGIRRAGKISKLANANLIFDEFDRLAKKKKHKEENKNDDETPGAIWQLLDELEKDKKLLIGTCNEIKGFPGPLQNRLALDLDEFYYKVLLPAHYLSNNVWVPEK